MPTAYLGPIVRANGYAGESVTLFLCQEPHDGDVLAVHPLGYYRIPRDCWDGSPELALLGDETPQSIPENPALRALVRASTRSRGPIILAVEQ